MARVASGIERELDDLEREFALMLNRATVVLGLAAMTLETGDAATMQRAVAADADVDAYHAQLEARCNAIIARHQLLARNARTMTGVISSLSDLERIGDYAAHVAEDALEVTDRAELHALARLLLAMANDLADALRDRDAAKAASVVVHDLEVDVRVKELNAALLERGLERLERGEVLSMLAALRIVRGLQRVGDHLENVAEHAQFWLGSVPGR